MQQFEIIAALSPIIKLFEELKIGYYIGGSVASSVYGLPRTTLDADLVTDLNIHHVKILTEKLSNDYYVDEKMITEALKRRSSFNLIHLESMTKVDVFILKENEYGLKSFGRKKAKYLDESNSLQVYLCSPEDIILSKLEWYKAGDRISERQWLDVLGVIKVQGDSLDIEYLGHWAKELDVFDLLQEVFNQGKN
ncbi:MAG: hypothetical protein V1720_10265 [bacterium]